jgi:hypothetical protein
MGFWNFLGVVEKFQKLMVAEGYYYCYFIISGIICSYFYYPGSISSLTEGAAWEGIIISTRCGYGF